METPPTPDHVQPDEEVDIPSGTLSLDLDLNPDLEYDDENTQNPFSRNTPQETPLNTPLNTRNDTPFSEDSGENRGNQISTEAAQIYPPNLEVSSWTLTFDEAFETLQKQFNEGAKHEPISLAQQSKFINYVDTQLLQIQRRFIKNQSEAAVTYSLYDLLSDLSPVIDLLWFSLLDHESLFGQEEYYIKIMGDLDDWVDYYSFPSLATGSAASTAFHVKLFDFLQKMDAQISFLIDGYDSKGKFSKMSATEIVRLSPIVMRLRLTIISKLEHSRAALSTSTASATNNVLNILDVEIGRLFEGILERI